MSETVQIVELVCQTASWFAFLAFVGWILYLRRHR